MSQQLWRAISVAIDQRRRNKLRALMRQLHIDPREVLHIAIDLLALAQTASPTRRAAAATTLAKHTPKNPRLTAIGDVIRANQYRRAAEAPQHGPPVQRRS